MIFLTEKKDGTIKARHCANGSPQREWIQREDVVSPTVDTESTILTAVIEGEEGRDVATCNIPNAFVQAQVEDTDLEGNRTIMKSKEIWLKFFVEWTLLTKNLLLLKTISQCFTCTYERNVWSLSISNAVLQMANKRSDQIWI